MPMSLENDKNEAYEHKTVDNDEIGVKGQSEVIDMDQVQDMMLRDIEARQALLRSNMKQCNDITKLLKRLQASQVGSLLIIVISRAPKGIATLLILPSVCIFACVSLRVCVCVCVCHGILPINTWPILMWNFAWRFQYFMPH